MEESPVASATSPPAALTAEEQRRQLLAKRLTTVYKLRREICQRRSSIPPVTQPSKKIPVPLFPEESLQKYTQRLEKWLAKRGQSLAALKGDPSKERNYWFSYAYLRVGPVDTEVDPFGRKRSYAFTPSYLDYLPESKSPRYDVNGGAVAIQQGGVVRRETPISQTVNDYRSVEPPAVAVNAGSMTKKSELRAAAHCREDIARCFLSSLAGPEPIQATAAPRIRDEQRVFTPSGCQYFPNALYDKQSGKTHGPQQQLKEIPVPLCPETISAGSEQQQSRGRRSKPNESVTPPHPHLTNNHGFRGQDAQGDVTLSSANIESTSTPANSDLLPRESRTQATELKRGSSSVPPHLASARCGAVAVGVSQLSQSGDGIKRARDAGRKSEQPETSTRTQPSETKCTTKARASAKNSTRTFQSGAVQTEDFPASGGQTKSLSRVSMDHGEPTEAAPSPEALPSWAVSLIDRVQELETQVTKLQRETEHCHSGACTRHVVNRELLSDEKALGSCPKAGDDADFLSPPAVPSQSCETVPTASPESDDVSPALVNSSLKKRQLVEEYIRLTDVITTNETAINDALEYVKAINDALEYVKAIKEVDEAQATENQWQIMELTVEINQKREQRSAVLAALISCSWAGKKESLGLVEENSAPLGSKSKVTHEELARVFTQMMKKSKEMDDLGTQLSDQVQLVKTLPPSVTEAGKALRSKKMRELSYRLSEEEHAKEELENECRQMLRGFLQIDVDVRELVKRSLV